MIELTNIQQKTDLGTLEVPFDQPIRCIYYVLLAMAVVKKHTFRRKSICKKDKFGSTNNILKNLKVGICKNIFALFLTHSNVCNLK